MPCVIERRFIPTDRSSATMAALLRASSRTVSKALGDQTRGYKVAVLGAAGGIGQPCGLLMKMVRRRSHPSHLTPETLGGDRWTIRPDLAAGTDPRHRPPSSAEPPRDRALPLRYRGHPRRRRRRLPRQHRRPDQGTSPNIIRHGVQVLPPPGTMGGSSRPHRATPTRDTPATRSHRITRVPREVTASPTRPPRPDPARSPPS